MTKEERKEYMRAWRQSHKDEIKAYKQKHKGKRKEYMRAWQQSHKAERKAYKKAYYQVHKKDYYLHEKLDLNSLGQTKHSVRRNSRDYLFNTLKHHKLKGYEIHHCFGYDDYKCFIYIPKELHLQIHQFLRDNGISADSNHFSQIVHLINAWEGYTYIKV